MFIRDVNNYIGEYTNGKLKRKGVYEYKMHWHQNQSALVVKKAAEAHLIHGTSIKDFILNHDDIMDFMLRTNVQRKSRLTIEYDGVTIPLQNTTRYYISETGGSLIKIMPPLKNKVDERHIKINGGFNVTPVNTMTDLRINDVNYDWYIREAHKLVDPLWSGALKDLML